MTGSTLRSELLELSDRPVRKLVVVIATFVGMTLLGALAMSFGASGRVTLPLLFVATPLAFIIIALLSRSFVSSAAKTDAVSEFTASHEQRVIAEPVESVIQGHDVVNPLIGPRPVSGHGSSNIGFSSASLPTEELHKNSSHEQKLPVPAPAPVTSAEARDCAIREVVNAGRGSVRPGELRAKARGLRNASSNPVSEIASKVPPPDGDGAPISRPQIRSPPVQCRLG
jgi:hypothetical protein